MNCSDGEKKNSPSEIGFSLTYRMNDDVMRTPKGTFWHKKRVSLLLILVMGRHLRTHPSFEVSNVRSS